MKNIITWSAVLFFTPSFAQIQTKQFEKIFPLPEKVTTINMGVGCRVQMTLPKHAQVGVHYESSDFPGRSGIGIPRLPNAVAQWSLGLQCYKSTDDVVVKGWAAPASDGWRLNTDESTAELQRLNALRFYKVQARNSMGWAASYDDTIGDEGFRQRTMAYCLIKNARALCGETKVGLIASIAKKNQADLSRYVLRLLESIQFVEDVVPVSNDGLESGRR